MNGFDLSGIDDGLSIKAQLMDQLHFRPEALFVVDVAVYRVDGIDSSRSGCQQNHAAAKQQLNAAGRALGLQIRHIVLGAKCNADQPRGGKSDLFGIEDTCGTFDCCHHTGSAFRDAVLPFNPGDDLLTVQHILRRLRFRQPDHCFLGPYNGLQIIHAAFGSRIVDPHHKFLAPVIHAAKGLVNQKTGCVLLRQRDGVFQVKHDTVLAIDASILDHTRIVSGHKEHGSAQLLHRAPPPH